MLGQLLLHYRVMEKIGEGGQGTVYKVIDTTLDRPARSSGSDARHGGQDRSGL
jgi:serine/threonine protein kinase